MGFQEIRVVQKFRGGVLGYFGGKRLFILKLKEGVGQDYLRRLYKFYQRNE